MKSRQQIRLTSLTLLPIDVSEMSKPKINRTQTSSPSKKSSIRTSLKFQDIHDNPPLSQTKQQQVREIKLFVEQFSADPRFLERLVDYQQLISNLRQEQLQILQEISQQKIQRTILKQKIQQTNQFNQKSVIYNLRKQFQDINLQIKKVDQKSQKLVESKKIRIQEKKQRLANLTRNLKKMKQLEKIELQSINKSIVQSQKKSKSLLSAIKLKENLIEQQRVKSLKNNQKKQIVEILKRQIARQRKTIIQLKNQQNIEISNHKKSIENNKKEEVDFKKMSQKKLNKFVSELIKIIDKNDRKSFDSLILTHQVQNIQTRNSNKSYTTKSDSNDDEDNQFRNPFIFMELEYPQLKELRQMNLKRIEETKNDTAQIEKYEIIEKQQAKTVKQFEEKLIKLNEQQADSDSFIQALRQKLNKINTQIKNPNKSMSVFN